VRDLFSAKPIVITGRFTGSPAGKITIKGYQGSGDFARSIPINFSSAGSANAALEKIWARNKVEDLMSRDWSGIQSGDSKHKAEIIQVGLEHSLATQYTSFVAVEERTVVTDGKPVRIEVPVELPQGVSVLAVPGERSEKDALLHVPKPGLTVYGYSTNQAGSMSGGPASAPSPAAPPIYATNQTVEVTAEAPTVETSLAQLEAAPAKKTAKDARLKQAEAKLSPELLTTYRCAVLRGATAAGKACKPVPAQLTVTVDLTDNNAGLEQKLKTASFKLVSGSGTEQLTGTIAPAKLRQLAQIAEVKSVSLSQ